MNRLAVLISDIHYNLQTLPLADAALRQAIQKANQLEAPVIIAGDLHDSKANLRGECVKAMIETIKLAKIPPIILRGNHDQINEKSEDHSLEFLKPYATIVVQPTKNLIPGWTFVPYQYDYRILKKFLQTLKKDSSLIMHQGIQGSNSGEYFQDYSALDPQDVAGFRVISGHYHFRQTIKLPNNGVWDYIGNPYTLTFGEAKDPEKGFQILKDDGTLEFVPTNLRKHIIYEFAGIPRTGIGQLDAKSDDLVWLKIHDTKENLLHYTRECISKDTGLQNFKLDLIPVDSELKQTMKVLNNGELLDSIIDSADYTPERKANLKELWRKLSQ